MDKIYDANDEELREGFYIGKGDRSIILYLSQEEGKWMMEMPGVAHKYGFHPHLSRSIERVDNLQRLLNDVTDTFVFVRDRVKNITTSFQ